MESIKEMPLKIEGISKDYIQQKTFDLVEMVKSGELDALTVLSSINGLEQICKNVRSGIMDDCIDQFENVGEKELVLNNAKFVKKEVGVKYDFSNTEYWNQLKDEENEAAKNRKDFEDKIKTFDKKAMITIDDELVEIMPPIRTSTTIIQVSIK
ncbi:MAG: hypothetical protein KDC67_03085 [Ignavibacteriae bacterium]|nr:hypothetical protein [Ignavibacteriota bacterium]